MSPDDVAYHRRAIEQWKQKDLSRAEVRERRGPSYDYNCHGLTFLSRRAWLDEQAAIGLVLEDDGYREVAPNEVLPGDIVVYRDRAGAIEHTAIVVSVDGTGPLRVPWVVSKWGASGEYIHPFNKSLYNGTPLFLREGPMTIQELIAEIEEGSVRADLGLASTTYTLLKRMADNPVLRKAKRQLFVHPKAVGLFLERAIALSESLAPEGYAHPGDLALSAYLFILARVPTREVEALVDRVARTAGGEFFAAKAVAGYFASRLPATAVIGSLRAVPSAARHIATLITAPAGWSARATADQANRLPMMATTEMGTTAETQTRVAYA